jgi:GH3 auxin-responsive promoter
MFSYVCNTCWMASCLSEARAYARDVKNVAGVQSSLLLRIVQRNRDTWFGRRHCFAGIRSVRDFQNAVPLSDYEDFRAPIGRIADGERNVLTAETVRLLEPTGGSSTGEKLIPYTASLQKSFQRALRTWIWDLYSRRPAVRRGRAYWSISPISQIERRTKADIPIGFDDDAAYLGHFARRIARKMIVAPRELARCPSVAAAQYATLFFLLRASDLRLISVWSPTFLIELLKLMHSRWNDLCDDVSRGQITATESADDDPVTHQRYQPLPSRAVFLRRVFRNHDDIAQCAASIWPSLAIVSCWADGPSLVHANDLRRYLPHVEIQPKGLLATEAFVTVPLFALPAPSLAIRSHFFEFLPLNAGRYDESTRPLLAHELTKGFRYRVVVTTEGGLYRYQLHDEVEVVGFSWQAPLLCFLGKTNETSDLVGEKLNAAHVQFVLQSAFCQLKLSPTYSQLRGDLSPSPGYVLQIAVPVLRENSLLPRRLRDIVEHGLCSNSAYRYALDLNQLRPLRIEVLDQQHADTLSANHTRARLAAGQRLGDIKPTTVAALPKKLPR